MAAFDDHISPTRSGDLRGQYEKQLSGKPAPEKAKTHGKLAPIVSKDKVKVKKTSIFRKLGDVFIANDPVTVRQRVFDTIFVPSIQDLLMEMAWGGLSMLFYDRPVRPRGRGRGYHDIYEDRQRGGTRITREGDKNDNKISSGRFGTSRLIDQLEFYEYADAKELFDGIMDVMDEYKVVSIADVMDLCEKDHTYADNYWGWTNLSSMSIKGTGGAFTIIFPRAKDISNFVSKED